MNTASEVIANAHRAFGDMACPVTATSGTTSAGTPAGSPGTDSVRACRVGSDIVSLLGCAGNGTSWLPRAPLCRALASQANVLRGLRRTVTRLGLCEPQIAIPTVYEIPVACTISRNDGRSTKRIGAMSRELQG